MFADPRRNARSLAVAGALILSGYQSRFFPCNKLSVLSVIGTIVTVLILYGTCEAVFTVATDDDRTSRDKLVGVAAVTIAGGTFLAGAATFTLLTHICP